MGLWSLRSRAGALGVAAPVLLLTGSLGHAACYSPQQQLPAPAIAQFKANPAQLLTQYPEGGAPMISTIRDLVASDPTTLPLVLSLLPAANDGGRNGIGAGLGQAALVCVHTDQAFANEIQESLAASASGGHLAASAPPRAGTEQRQAVRRSSPPQQSQTGPDQILANFPSGGGAMIAAISELALADPANLPMIIGLLPKANEDQGKAIGTGLGEAARAAVKTNPAYATQIQEAVVEKSGGERRRQGGRRIGSAKNR